MAWYWKWTIDIDDVYVHPKERMGGGKTTKRYIPNKTRESMEDLKKRYMIYMIGKYAIAGNVRIRFSFSLWTTMKWNPKKKRGDIDNLYKTITDAANGMLWEDDNQIISIGSCNLYHNCKKNRLLIGIETEAGL